MVDVSIILAVGYNAEKWLDEALNSIYNQRFSGTLELSVYLDACSDVSEDIVRRWRKKLVNHVHVIFSNSKAPHPCGAGYAKNVAVKQSTGCFLCFLDADDCMSENRIEKQFDVLSGRHNVILGCKFHRRPENSTTRYTDWSNGLSPQQLYTQAYTSHGPTIIAPTWFFSRQIFNSIGGFHEGGKGVPEDLMFFYKHLEMGGELERVDEDLVMYRYHPACTTFSISEETIWKLRLTFLEQQVLSEWSAFTIWNAGKQGRKFYRSLTDESRRKVIAFCDVDAKKIRQSVYTHQESSVMPKPTVPIIHFTQAIPPFIICVKLGLTQGQFEENLSSLKLTEGIDYYHFN